MDRTDTLESRHELEWGQGESDARSQRVGCQQSAVRGEDRVGQAPRICTGHNFGRGADDDRSRQSKQDPG